jgi:hypothetical protein
LFRFIQLILSLSDPECTNAEFRALKEKAEKEEKEEKKVIGTEGENI